MTKKLIKFYKGICLNNIHEYLIQDHAYSVSEIDELMKYKSGIQKSCNDMTSDELNELIVTCFNFADEIGLDLNFLNNECEFIREL